MKQKFRLLVEIYLEHSWAFILSYQVFYQLRQVFFNSVCIISVICFIVTVFFFFLEKL